MHLGTPYQIGDVLRAHGHTLRGAVGDLARDLAAQLADLALQLADACFACIAGDHLAERAVRQCQLIRQQAVLTELPRNEIALGDLELFSFRVSREVDGLQTVEQRRRNALQEVRGRDEQDLREIERHAEVVIRERVVLSRVEHFQ